jgi:hypothetical protein
MSYFREVQKIGIEPTTKKDWLKNVSNIATQQVAPWDAGTEHARETS